MRTDDAEKKLEQVLKRLDDLTEQMKYGQAQSDTERRYRDALKDAVDTLEATKSMFKSKQLKALRERLEAVLNETD